MTLLLLHKESKQSHPNDLTYSQFCEQYRRFHSSRPLLQRHGIDPILGVIDPATNITSLFSHSASTSQPSANSSATPASRELLPGLPCVHGGV